MKHTYVLNPEENGGESVILETQIDAISGDIVSQSLELNSYGKTAVLTISGLLTPQKLRHIADQIEGIQVLNRA